jgi:3-methyladenine DNA glycosylase AlkD
VAPLSEAFRQTFETNADAEVVPAMRAYMRDQFPFLGIRTPERRKLS